MSPFQLAKQIRYLLRTAVWGESPGNVVFGTSVYVTPGIRDNDDVPGRLPFALINLGAQRPDDDDPDLFRQEVIVVIAASVHGDPLGEHSLTGGPGAASGRHGKSEGRGLLELETAALDAVGSLTGADGTPILVSHVSSAAPERVGQDVHLVTRQYVLEVVCTRSNEYPAPQHLVGDVSVAGQVTVSWTLPPVMYGRREMILRRASGSTAPTSATAGTPVTLGSTFATSVVVSGLSAGAHSFAVFMAYTESGASSNEFFSAQVVGAYRTFTVT